LLDEPTTHLDVAGVEALTRAFKNYKGTLCFISHDLYFIREIANHIVEVDEGRVRDYPGSLDYYLDKKQGGTSSESAVKKASVKAGREAYEEQKKSRRDPNEPENLRVAREQHEKALKRLQEIKNQLKALEREEKDLETETYIKSRTMNAAFSGRSRDEIAECGRRLKEIQVRLREIETARKQLIEERDRTQQV
jgi:ATP-binding cassette subfamily F protein 3